MRRDARKNIISKEKKKPLPDTLFKSYRNDLSFQGQANEKWEEKKFLRATKAENKKNANTVIRIMYANSRVSAEKLTRICFVFVI